MSARFGMMGRRAFLCGCCSAVGYFKLLRPTLAEDINIASIEMAPFHMIPFTNEYVRFVNAKIPAGKIGSWHRHTRDFAYVYLEVSPVEATNLGGKPTRASRKAGDVVFAPYAKQPIVHQVANIGTADFQVIGIELLEGLSDRFEPQDRPTPYVKVLDNDRIVGWRLILEPDQSAPSIFQAAPAARFVVQSGDVVETYHTGTKHELNLSHSDFAWLNPGSHRSIKNVGTSVVELVEFELR
ncbi:hypothetical protein ACRAWG_00305 [Methylobacterium sp. P31]